MVKPVLFAVFVLVFAGCSGPEPSTQAAPSSGPATGSVAVVGTDNATLTGTIVGSVRDEESQPIPGATVALPALQVTVRTTDEGLFRIEKVPAGKQAIHVQVLGYMELARAVEVVPDEEVSATFILVAIPVEVPRQVSLPHTFFIHLGAYGTSFAGGDTPSCEACEWIPKIDPDPSYVIIEIRGKHTVPYPTRPDGLAVFLYKNGNTNSFSGCNWIAADNDPPCIRLPMRREFDQETLTAAVPAEAETKVIRFWQWCDPFWFCVEERYDEWFTLFYDTDAAAVPKDFTAFPQ